MRQLGFALLLSLCLATCRPASCDEDAGDFGLPTSEVSRTLQRLFAIPTTAYTNAAGEAGADMRPAMPTFTFGPDDGGIMKMAVPTFALSQTSGSKSVGSNSEATTTALYIAPQIKALASAAKAVASQQRSVAAATGAALSASSLSASKLASVESQRVKALAQARLMKKHLVLASIKHEHVDVTDAGPSVHGRAKPANLDSQISGSSKWLAKAVMALALIAGTCICGGICGEDSLCFEFLVFGCGVCGFVRAKECICMRMCMYMCV